MVARLVFDALWRNRWFYVLASVPLVPCWLLYASDGSNVLGISISAMSLIFAAMLGPLFAVATMGLRALRHLPVTSRDLWRATWVAATVVSSGVLLATKAICVLLVAASGGSPKVSAEAMLLSARVRFHLGWRDASGVAIAHIRRTHGCSPWNSQGNAGPSRLDRRHACLLRPTDPGGRRVADTRWGVHARHDGHVGSRAWRSPSARWRGHRSAAC